MVGGRGNLRLKPLVSIGDTPMIKNSWSLALTISSDSSNDCLICVWSNETKYFSLKWGERVLETEGDAATQPAEHSIWLTIQKRVIDSHVF